jgi:branched-chain amino acid transport system permease protein
VDALLRLIVAGLADGGLYALLALGLALIYQVSGVVNFAQGALATVGAYILWSATTNAGLPFWPAVAVTLVVTFLLGMLLQALLLRPLRRASPAASLIVTLGLLSVIEGVIGQVFGFDMQTLTLPVSFVPIQIGTLFLSRLNLITIGVTVTLIVAFFAFLRWTRAGASLRAVAQSTRGARLVGVRVDRVLLIAWGISAAIAAVAGILIAGQTTTLSPGMADLYLLSAFAGAVVGGLDSLPGAAVAALCMGVIQNLVAAYISMQWRDAVVFGLLLAVLLVRPAGVFGPVVQRRV